MREEEECPRDRDERLMVTVLPTSHVSQINIPSKLTFCCHNQAVHSLVALFDAC